MTHIFQGDTVSVIDVLDTGACLDGVKNFIRSAGVIVGKLSDYPNEPYIQAVGNGDGNGYGYGYGYI